jgi:septum site-determining protein MinD
MGRVYAVASGKGGVGKTTTVANLGAALAEGGHEVVVVDVDLGMGNLAGVMGVDAGAGPTIHDVLAGRATVAEAVREGPSGTSVLPGSPDLDDFGAADPSNLDALVAALDAETVLLDTSAGLSHDTVEPLRVADAVVLVSTPDREAVGDAGKLGEVADRVGTPVVGVVVTRADSGAGVAAVGDSLGVPVRGSVPEDAAVSEAASAAEPLVVAAPGAPAARAYRRLAADLIGDATLAPPPTERDVRAAERGDDAVDAAEDEADDGAGGTAATAAASAPRKTATADEAGIEVAEAAVDGEGDERTAAAAESGDDPDAEDGEPADDDDGDGRGRTGLLRWLLR